jgi:UDP-2,3-diacylglucosamine pyrophosphatase LpxH
MSKRSVDLVIISDVHLGTYGSHAAELVRYLKSIEPKVLVLNGDIIDIWQFSKRYWPKSHMQVLKELVRLAANDTPVYYLTGNHDELLRKFSGFSLGNFHLLDQLVLDLGGRKTWIFHGDIFDASMQYAKWLAKLGAIGYDLLILLNSFCNWLLARMGRPKMSFSKRVKQRVKTAVSYIGDFEQAAAAVAIERGYDFVACGHIHQPQIREIATDKGSITYLNSGDWVENLTALEYHGGMWYIYPYSDPGADRSRELTDVLHEASAPLTLPRPVPVPVS